MKRPVVKVKIYGEDVIIVQEDERAVQWDDINIEYKDFNWQDVQENGADPDKGYVITLKVNGIPKELEAHYVNETQLDLKDNDLTEILALREKISKNAGPELEYTNTATTSNANTGTSTDSGTGTNTTASATINSNWSGNSHSSDMGDSND
jgi:hypothetical protein